ncbi:MAG: hypothetical protein CLLPBCKN_004097 [Chroococcidiopsis cubana SAG 39.79]|uniref:hypothetical protein n=1 Tax=Chroococcidiopsis cubana TaxID=171392 RepID=UPI002AC46DF4|nr:hypothetical protein [Chroococcidiopsis cubana]MDZ4874701.1 hypothetical protein [Chroococcidiopsis cubana SAG 39.79]
MSDNLKQVMAVVSTLQQQQVLSLRFGSEDGRALSLKKYRRWLNFLVRERVRQIFSKQACANSASAKLINEL